MVFRVTVLYAVRASSSVAGFLSLNTSPVLIIQISDVTDYRLKWPVCEGASSAEVIKPG
jgi:hypothetical protein